MVKADAGAPARVAAVPEKTVVAPDVMTTESFAQRSVADPLTGPLFDCTHAAPGVSVNVLAAIVPEFVIAMDVVDGVPGTMARFPPNLLIVVQVAVLTETPPPSVLLQVTAVPLVVVSCMVSTPAPAVLVLFVMLATKPDIVPVMERDRSAAPRTPVVIAAGVNLRRVIRGVLLAMLVAP